MRIGIFSNCLNVDVEFRTIAKNSQTVFCFLDNCIWNGYGKLSLLQRRYLSSGVNILTNSLNISHITNRDIFKLNFLQRNEKYDRSALIQILQEFKKF